MKLLLLLVALLAPVNFRPIVLAGHVDSPFLPENPVLVLLDRTDNFTRRDHALPVPEDRQIAGGLVQSGNGYDYRVILPVKPAEDGLRIFTLEIAQHYFGAPTLHPLEQRFEQGTSSWTSIVVGEAVPGIIGGAVLVYAPDDSYLFPSAFGADMRLFTEDDPVDLLPQGYSVVYLDASGFRVEPPNEMTLHPQSGVVPLDLSALDEAVAFDRLVNTLADRYAYTGFRKIDWEALRSRYRDRLVAADPIAYYRALYEFSADVGDMHVFAAPSPDLAALISGDTTPQIIAPSTSSLITTSFRRTSGETIGAVSIRGFGQPADTLKHWLGFLRAATSLNAPEILIDLRESRGGDGALATIMAAHLFGSDHPLTFDGLTMSRYDSRLDAFAAMPLENVRLNGDFAYMGDVTVIVGPSCASACELFVYLLRNRASIIGAEPTAGAGGAVTVVRMPSGVDFYYTFIRAESQPGQPAWEGAGIAPSILCDAQGQTSKSTSGKCELVFEVTDSR